MQLFEEREGKVTLSAELKLVPEFKSIISSDKDPSKRGALRIFTYIYFVYDYKSPYYQSLPLNERKVKVMGDLHFDANWKEDLNVLTAVNKYLQFLETASLKMLCSLREGLFTARDAVEVLTKKLSEEIQSVKDDDEPGGMDNVMGLIDNLFKVSDKLPKMLDTLTSLEERVKTEQSNESKIRGGGTKGYFEE